MGSSESKASETSSSVSSGPSNRGAEVISTVPLAKEEHITWKIENIATMINLAKDSSEFRSMAEKSYTNFEFEIEPENGIGWTAWRLCFSVQKPRDPVQRPEYFSLLLKKQEDHGEDKVSSKKWFEGGVLVKMELLKDTKLTTRRTKQDDPFAIVKDKGAHDPLVKNMTHDVNNFMGWENFLSIDTLYESRCKGGNTPLDSSSITISLKITFQYLQVTTTSRQLSSYEALNHECTQDFKKFVQTLFEQSVQLKNSSPSASELADSGSAVLRISGKYILVQKCFLISRSPVFKTIFDASMKQNRSSVVEIDDIDYPAMLSVLEYIYTGNLPISGKSQEAWKKFPSDVLKASEKYELPLLKRFCEENLAQVCTKENAKELYDLARRYKFENAKKQIWDLIRGMDPDGIL